ncbi:low-temperature-induced 65 kDa protein-like isoform X2 [Durio zibethinus]|uniref:Low-temperature-induced 65 kDa protein-like isoform X2 n=1 Tax=Durio zibethinus TaxID=66656 RepID=A0A6P5XW59_DURZI|nr:low-temperature-induced 65 kDa protein-like isoform X2 [Durio zibethinus]
MAQLDPMHQYGDNPRSTTNPTVEHLRVGEAQTWSPRSHASSTTYARSHEVHDTEDVQYHSKKLTVIAKVKDKARRWRHSLIKKKHSEGDNSTPSWGVRLEDEDYEDEDPEYLGAPMYESELAPEGYKENARQNPRAVPVISEKHVLASSVKPVSEQGKKEPTLAETKAKKPAPANATGTDATRNITSMTQGLFVSAPTGSETEKHATHEAGMYATQETDKHLLKTDSKLSPRENKWDKGVSVKAYIMNKFEPGEDEKALSQVISNAISPRRTPGDVGVLDKVKGAVNSLLWREEPTQSTIKQSDTNSFPQIPVSTNAQTVLKEDNSGRILQTN